MSPFLSWGLSRLSNKATATITCYSLIMLSYYQKLNKWQLPFVNITADNPVFSMGISFHNYLLRECLCQTDLYHTCYLCTGLIQPLLHVIKRASQIIPKWFYPIWYHPNMLFTSMVNSSYFLNIIDSPLSCVFTESVPLLTVLNLGISTSHLLSKTYSSSESCWGLVCYVAPTKHGMNLYYSMNYIELE